MTPNVPNGGRCLSAELVANKGMTAEGEKRTVGLESQTRHWATPNAHDGRRPGADLHSTQGANLSRDAALWATPDCNTSTYSNGKFGPNLRQQTSDWPTPRATKGTKGGPNQAGSKGDLMPPSAAAQWPTPSASVANDGESPESWHARMVAVKAKAMNGNGAGLPLTIAATQWPTPASRDFRTPNSQESQESRKHTGGEQLPNFVEHHFLPQGLLTADGQTSCTPPHGSPRRLNPAFGCWLMGWPSWWTNPGLTSCAKSAMELYRYRLQQHLLSLCGAPARADQ